MTTEPTSYDNVRGIVNQHVTEALGLRYQSSPLEPGMAPQAVLNSLIAVRQRLDRVDEIYTTMIRLRGSAQRAADRSKAVADEAWDAAAAEYRAGEFEGPRERYARHNLRTIAQQRASRQAKEIYELCREGFDVVQACQRGLDGVRQDHLTYLRSLQFESHLER